ncbi:hypothetical protein [Dermatobacter hominis]|uniref:hypothetical protein n=1 Tax=Dermatobacter hominis TaxID=2884263 RepID=UPI001D129BD2|nr:hypothetical protein [Dermatobacter hominis]UDY36033.1 hypothetical protein LH044_00500 [Dermatobacter hominis]
MPGMPFYVEKGPQFQFIEEFVLGPGGPVLLTELRRNHPNAGAWISQIATKVGLGTASPKLSRGPGPAARVQHLNEHWFEQTQAPDGTWKRDADPQEPMVQSDGQWAWWHAYAGDVYEIMRWTMIRAGEVSLGIGATDEPGAGRQDPWPIELFWHCSQNWFEGWVTWRRNGATGQVTVLLCTPTAGTPVRPSPLASLAPASEQPQATEPNYGFNPPTPGGPRGTVVVTHALHTFVRGGPTQLSTRSPKGAIPPPPADYWRGVGPVVAVSPSWPDGGVL